jgi:hypothetical protein
MKKTIIILSTLVLIANSCGNRQVERQVFLNENELSKDTTFLVSDYYGCENFNLDSFPKEWIQLTMHEGRYVIYEAFGLGNRQLRFSRNNGRYELLMYGTQEEYAFNIERTYKVNDTIFVHSRWKGTRKEITHVTIQSDRNTHRMRTIVFNDWDLFVDSKKASDYEVIIEEDWGEENWEEEID